MMPFLMAQMEADEVHEAIAQAKLMKFLERSIAVRIALTIMLEDKYVPLTNLVVIVVEHMMAMMIDANILVEM